MDVPASSFAGEPGAEDKGCCGGVASRGFVALATLEGPNMPLDSSVEEEEVRAAAVCAEGWEVEVDAEG